MRSNYLKHKQIIVLYINYVNLRVRTRAFTNVYKKLSKTTYLYLKKIILQGFKIVLT